MPITSTMRRASAIEPMPSTGVRSTKSDERDEGRHHEQIAMGEVHHADDAENHRVADGDEAIDGAKRQPIDELLDEDCHAGKFTPLEGDPVVARHQKLRRAKRKLPRNVASRTMPGFCNSAMW